MEIDVLEPCIPDLCQEAPDFGIKRAGYLKWAAKYPSS